MSRTHTVVFWLIRLELSTLNQGKVKLPKSNEGLQTFYTEKKDTCKKLLQTEKYLKPLRLSRNRGLLENCTGY